MEGATLSGRRTAAYICGAGEELLALRKKLVIDDSEKALGNVQVLQTSWTTTPADKFNLSNHTCWNGQIMSFSRFRVLAIPAATSCISNLSIRSAPAGVSYPWIRKAGCLGGIRDYIRQCVSWAGTRLVIGTIDWWYDTYSTHCSCVLQGNIASNDPGSIAGTFYQWS